MIYTDIASVTKIDFDALYRAVKNISDIDFFFFQRCFCKMSSSLGGCGHWKYYVLNKSLVKCVSKTQNPWLIM